ncbi:MAG: hypothetical protein AAFR33_03775 [Pseudomonadota bacterium]
MKPTLLFAAIAVLAGASHAQSPFVTTDSEARLSQRSTIVGDYNRDAREDVIYQGAYASAPTSGALNPHAQKFIEQHYGSGPIFSYDQSFVNQFAYNHGEGNTIDMAYAGVDDGGTPGQGGIDSKMIFAEQIAIQRGNGNDTHLSGDITQVGRPIGPAQHGDLLDINLEVITQVGVQVGDDNDLSLDLTTEQSDR